MTEHKLDVTQRELAQQNGRNLEGYCYEDNNRFAEPGYSGHGT